MKLIFFVVLPILACSFSAFAHECENPSECNDNIYCHFSVGSVSVSNKILATENALLELSTPFQGITRVLTPGINSGGRLHIKGRELTTVTVNTYYHHGAANSSYTSDDDLYSASSCNHNTINFSVNPFSIVSKWSIPDLPLGSCSTWLSELCCFAGHYEWPAEEPRSFGNCLRVVVAYLNDGYVPSSSSSNFKRVLATIPTSTVLDNSINSSAGGFVIRYYDLADSTKERYFTSISHEINTLWDGKLYTYSSITPTPPSNQTGVYCSSSGLGMQAIVYVLDKYTVYTDANTLDIHPNSMVFDLPENYPLGFIPEYGLELNNEEATDSTVEGFPKQNFIIQPDNTFTTITTPIQNGYGLWYKTSGTSESLQKVFRLYSDDSTTHGLGIYTFDPVSGYTETTHSVTTQGTTTTLVVPGSAAYTGQYYVLVVAGNPSASFNLYNEIEFQLPVNSTLAIPVYDDGIRFYLTGGYSGILNDGFTTTVPTALRCGTPTNWYFGKWFNAEILPGEYVYTAGEVSYGDSTYIRAFWQTETGLKAIGSCGNYYQYLQNASAVNQNIYIHIVGNSAYPSPLDYGDWGFEISCTDYDWM